MKVSNYIFSFVAGMFISIFISMYVDRRRTTPENNDLTPQKYAVVVSRNPLREDTLLVVGMGNGYIMCQNLTKKGDLKLCKTSDFIGSDLYLLEGAK